jgi:hypothetical protein
VKLSNPVHKLGLGNNADWCTICRDNLDLLLMLSQLPGFWDITTVGHLANEMANRRIGESLTRPRLGGGGCKTVLTIHACSRPIIAECSTVTMQYKLTCGLHFEVAKS